MNEPIFYNSNGTLTKYALFCGYVESKQSDKGTKKMFIEHNHIHVKHYKIDDVSISTELWNTFETNELAKARKLFNSIKIN